MTGEILFLSHRMPFPPDRGDKIRSHHVLNHLAKIAPVHVATFADDDRDMAEEVELAAIAHSYCLVRRTKPLIVAGLQALIARRPASFLAFDHELIREYVAQTLRERQICAIYGFSGQMGQYIPDDFSGRVIFDFVDVDSAKFEAYAKDETGVRRWINKREGRLLGQQENRIARRADISLLVSPEEAALFIGRMDAESLVRSDVRVLRNGIDSQVFDPAAVSPKPRLLECDGPRVIFAGQMNYRPNAQAALRAIDQIMPLIRQTIPSATLHIVGRDPDEELVERHGVDGVYVWGAVDDIRTWLRAADLALIPLGIARGVQNKVLEALAMSLPVVLSSAAASGIGATDGQHLVIGHGDQDMADRAAALLAHPRQAALMGMAARRFVIENLSWQATLAPLAEMIGSTANAQNSAG